jgi:hypothetical protein
MVKLGQMEAGGSHVSLSPATYWPQPEEPALYPGWLIPEKGELIYLNHGPGKQGQSGERRPIVWMGTLRL